MPHKDLEARRAYQREYQRAWNKRNRERRREIERESIRRNPQARVELANRYRERHPEKVRAQHTLQRAVSAGKITRLPCEVCGVSPAHGHHDDYSKPLDVRWLCPAHHVREHQEAMA